MDALGSRSSITRSISLCVIIALAPWFSGGNEPIALLITTFALLLATLLAWRQSKVPLVGDRRLAWLYISLVAWAALSLIWTVSRYQSVVWILYLLLAGLTFVVVARERLVPEFRSKVIGGYLVVCAIASIYGLWLYLTSDFPRLTSSFYWPNPMAAYLIPAIIIGLEKSPSGWRYRILTLLLFVAFLLTDSRGGAVVLIVCLIIYWLWQRPKKPYWIHLLFIFILAIGLSIGTQQIRTKIFHQNASSVPGARFVGAASDDDTSLTDRVNYLNSAVQIWYHHPFIGTGAGTYPSEHPQYQIRVISASNSAHNLYIQTLSELGLIGLFLLLVLLVYLLWQICGSTSSSEDIAIAIGVIGLLLHMGIDIDSRYPALIILAAVLAGLVYRPSARITKRSWVPVVAATLAVVVAISLYESGLWSIKASAAQDNGQYQLAATDYGRAHTYLVYDPDTITGEGINLYTLGSSANDTAQLQLALSKAFQAENQDPRDGQQYFLAARVQRALKLYPQALKSYQKAIALDPYDQPVYYTDLASLQLRLGQTAAALATLNHVIALYPSKVLSNRADDITLAPTLSGAYSLRSAVESVLGQVSAASRDATSAKAIQQQ